MFTSATWWTRFCRAHPSLRPPAAGLATGLRSLRGSGRCPRMARRTPAEAAAAFWARVDQLNGRPAPGAVFTKVSAPVALVCARGHECTPRPAAVLAGCHICRRCSQYDPAAEAAFWLRVRELGGRAQPGAEYDNANTPVPVWCAAGHDCRPKPKSLQGGQGLCRRCANEAVRITREAFWRRVADLGAHPTRASVYRDRDTPVALVCSAGHPCTPTPAKVIGSFIVCDACGLDRHRAEASFLSSAVDCGARLAPGARFVAGHSRVEMVCAAGHTCTPRPGDVRPGRQFCRSCGATRGDELEADFWARVDELGGRPSAGARYQDQSTPVAVMCAQGHACSPRPSNLRQRGTGLCKICGDNSASAAAAVFWARVVELGATAAPGATYGGRDVPVPLVCAAGHACSPTPKNVRAGQGPCTRCADEEAAALAKEQFWKTVRTHGARRQPGATYTNVGTPVPLICARGHHTAPYPNHVLAGGGVCGQCAVSYDRVYLLEHEQAGAIKVGIASGPKRVAVHRLRGYRLLAQWTGLEHGVAVAAERAVLANWREGGLEPVPGVPADGHTETAPHAARTRTVAALTAQLGPTEDAAVFLVPAA